MTKPTASARKRIAEHGPIVVILLLALLLRLDGVGFGLPALNDPDEPLFMLLAIDMLRRQSFNPQWFGHPGTITLYCLALILVAVGGIGIASGRFGSVDAFAAAVYADPGLVMLPARLFIVANGVACVWLTYRIGQALWGKRAGLIAALFLTVNALHIGWSQVIRTDVQASVFMLLCVLHAIAIHREGRTRDYVLAGIFAGLAVATKWPAAAILLCPLSACLARAFMQTDQRWRVVMLPFVALATLLAASPFLLIDHTTLIQNLSGEARPLHPGATGHGLWANLAWYFGGPLAGSLGILGLIAALLGVFGAMRRDRAWLVGVCPGFCVFLVMIAAQNLVWERWLVPLLPFFALGLAYSLGFVADKLRNRAKSWGVAALMAVLLVPMLLADHARSQERRHDTRQIASAWLRQHAPPGSSILVEHAAIDLLQGPWEIRFPLGAAGCIDAKAILAGQVTAGEVDTKRAGSPVVDLGHVDPAKMATCHTDYAVLSHWSRYRDERATYPQAYARYAELLARAHVVKTLHPRAGHIGGPEVQIVRLGAVPQ